jgi:hypothetical protein
MSANESAKPTVGPSTGIDWVQALCAPEDGCSCRTCGSTRTEWRIVETDSHYDVKHHCLDCNSIWWTDGDDG